MANPGLSAEQVRKVREQMAIGGSKAEMARRLGIPENTFRSQYDRVSLDPAIKAGMDAAGMEMVPQGGWIKTHEKDENGNTYSFRFSVENPKDDPAERMNELFRDLPRVKIPKPKKIVSDQIGFIPLNDLHAGAYAWKQETGYEDWDIKRAVGRLTDWIGNLVNRMPVVKECILFYNGDTLHANGNVPMTPGSGHILDTDGRHFKVADMTATAVITTVELAAQKHGSVRLVIKRGNHDEDSYLALLLAAKWRFLDTPHITVEEDPSPYWAFRFGKVFLFGHHGDRIKPEALVLKMAADHPEMWGQTRHRHVWTAHKHSRELKQFNGATWEQASCLTNPDAYGAYWGNQSLAQAVIYDKERGETERFTVRP